MRQLRYFTRRDVDLPDMSAVYIALFGRIKNAPSVSTAGDGIDFKFTRSQQPGISSSLCDRIKVQPSVALPGKDNRMLGRPEKLVLALSLVKDAAHAILCMPYFAAFACCNIGHADGPRISRPHWGKNLFFFVVGNANEPDLFAVRRPYRISIMIGAWVEIAQRLRFSHIHANKVVVS